MRNQNADLPLRRGRITLLLVTGVLVLASACASVSHAKDAPPAFESPLAGATALVGAARANDIYQVRRILGIEAADELGSGDEVADSAERARFLALFDESHSLEAADDGSFVLVVGELQWPFPFPLIETDAGWVFDTEEGRTEMLARRVGANELNAIQVCLAIVDAQREYAAEDRDDDGLLEFAQSFRSTPGLQDGLHWPASEGEEASPLGAFVAAATGEGYELNEDATQTRPYHGYYYRMLSGQGSHASGGAHDYLVRDSMIGGFAVLAYPARHGYSGVMSFLVNHDAVVLEKDLGPNTERIAADLEVFDPDTSWSESPSGNE